MNGKVETTCWTSDEDVNQVDGVYIYIHPESYRRRSYSTSSG